MPFARQYEQDDLELRRGLTRDITERQARVRDDPGFLYDVAKIGTLGLAAALLGRKVVRTDAFLQTMGFLGKKAQAVTAPVGGFVRGMMDEIAGLQPSYTDGIRRFDLMEQLTESIAATRQAQAAGKTTAEIQSLISATRQGLRDRGFEDLNRAGLSRLRPATAGDIFQSNRLQAAMHPDGFKVIREAHGLGMIGPQTSLTRGYGGLFVKAGERSPHEFVDTRWVSPRQAMGGAYNLARNLRVPFTGFRPADLVAAVLRPFGEGHFAGQVGRDLELAKGVRTGQGMNFVIGGRLLSETATGGFGLRATNLRLARSGRVGQAHLERYGNAVGYTGVELEERIRKSPRGGFKGFTDWLQHKTGVGWEYRTRDPVIKSRVIDAIRRRERGVVTPKPFVQRRYNEGFFDQLRTQAEAESRGIDPQRLLNEAQPGLRPLTFFDKVKAHLGFEHRAVVTIVRGAPIKPADVAVHKVEHVGNLAGRRGAVPGVDPVAPTWLGDKPNPPTVANEFYAFAGKGAGIRTDPGAWIRGQAEAAIDLLHYGTNRLNDLFGATVGLGFRPSVGKGIGGGLLGAGKNVAKIYGMFHGFHAGLEYLNYADFFVEQTIGQALPAGWDSPKKLAIRAYQGAQLARTGVRDLMGVDNLARYSEDLMPGSMDSGLSFLARTVLPAAAGVAKAGMPGLRLGAAFSLLFGGTEPGKTYQEQLAEFEGDKLVPVRKSRWWMLGRQPFQGGQIDHYEPHWTKRALSDFRFTDVQYGSKGEYFSNVSRIPTPHNLFGLVPLTQEGGLLGGGDLYLAKKHRLTRPYPDTPGIDSAEAEAMAAYISSRGPYDAPLGAGQRMGLGTAGTLPEPLERRQGMLGSIKDAGAELAELTGIYKFMFWDLPGFSEGQPPKLASYESINAQGRKFWDANLGGLGGMTELYRRFVSPEEGKQGVNPVPNLMPSWLPGLRSEFPRDRQYHVDFTLGDPYAKVHHGEFRLPGEGYERMYRLHSGSPGVYDAFDRFLVLSDLAPNSDAYKEYRAIVEGWAEAGVLDVHWASKFKITKDQVSEKMKRYQFYDRRFTGTITDPNPDVTADKYNLIEKAVGGAWEVASHDVVPKIGNAVPLLGTMLSDKLFPIYSPIEHYQRFQVYGEEFADWRSPWKQLLRPRLHTLAAEDPLTATAGGAAFGLFGANPVAALALSIAGGAFLGGASAARVMGTGQVEGGYVPTHRKRQWELEEYFDNIQYTKGRMLEERARDMGDEEMQDYFKDMWTRTTAALDYKSDQRDFMRQAMRGLSREQRGYFRDFAQMPAGAQESILPYLPPNMQPALVQAAGREEEGQFSKYRRWSQHSSDARVADYFSKICGMPDSNWGGWHPDVPMDAVKIKMIDAGANSTSADIHKFNLFNEHVFRASKFASLQVPDPQSLRVDREDSMQSDFLSELQDAGFENVRIRNIPGGRQEAVHWDVRRSRYDELREAVGRMFR